jgi:hypothetical protein
MKEFTLLLAVHSWSYRSEQSYDHDSEKYISSKRVTLRCFWEGGDDSEFYINKQRFNDPISIDIRIGPHKPLSEPLNLEFIGTRQSVGAVLGSAQHFPKRVDADSGTQSNSFVAANLWVSDDTFLELLRHRDELKRFHLTVLGSNVDLDWEGNPSWEYHSDRENRLFITGYSYVADGPDGGEKVPGKVTS